MIYLDGVVFSIQKHGGISVYFQELLRHVNNINIPCMIELTYPTKQSIENYKNINFHTHNSRYLERYRKSVMPINNGVFHSSYYRLPSQKKIATVVTVHDFVYERFSNGLKKWVHVWQKNKAIRSAQSLICVSKATKDDLFEFVGINENQQVHVIHNGVSDCFFKIVNRSSFRPYILYVGQRGGYKNFNLVANALDFLPDFQLWCVGGGNFNLDELLKYPEHVRKRIFHKGFPSNEDLNVLYNQAFCLAYPSAYEGFGIPVVEAMRAGCPVVTIKCKAVMEVGGKALTIADDADPRLIADCIIKLHECEYRSRVVLDGLDVSSNYSWEKCHSQTLSVYRSLGALD